VLGPTPQRAESCVQSLRREKAHLNRASGGLLGEIYTAAIPKSDAPTKDALAK